MSSGPITCPHCYKFIHVPPGSDGLVRCDACGHAFPASGAAGWSAGKSPSGYPGSSPFAGSSSYGAPPGGFGSSNYGPAGSSFGTSYPPAGGPQPSSGPSMSTCLLVVLGIGAVFLTCCGGVGVLVYMVGRQVQPVAQPPAPAPFNPPAFNPPPVIPPAVFPEGQPVIPDFSIPGIPTAQPKARTLDDVLAALKTASPIDFQSRNLLAELGDFPVDESRRGEVVQAVLKYLEGANVTSSHAAQEVLEKWASKAEANALAKFAAGEGDPFVRRAAAGVIAKTGGSAETAKTLVPLLSDLSMRRDVQAALEKIGPDAEDALLAHLDQEEFFLKNSVFTALGAVGGDKAAARLRAIVDKKQQPDAILARRALSEIEQRRSRGP